MLNKLLKRCMPWMDKGRWYKIDVGLDSLGELKIDHDPIFSNVSMEGPVLSAVFANIDSYQVVDVKFVGKNGFLSIGPNISISSQGQNEIDITLNTLGTIWLFIKFG